MKKSITCVLVIILFFAFILSLQGCSKKTQENSKDLLVKASESLKKEKYDEAKSNYSKVIEIDPKSFTAYVGRAKSKLRLADFKGALEDSQKALQLKPKNIENKIINAIALQGLGREKETINIINNLIKNNPKHAKLYQTRGNINARNGELEEALKDYNKGLKLNPKYSEIYLNKGVLYYKIGELEKAVKSYTKSIETWEDNPDNSPLAYSYYNRGITYEKLGEIEKAKEDFKKAREIDPKSGPGKMSETMINKFKMKDKKNKK